MCCLFVSFEETFICFGHGAFVTVLFLCWRAHLGLSQSCAPTRSSEALRWVVHMGSADSSATHGHLLALSFCSNSFLSRWSQSQTSGKSQWLIHCWFARDWETREESKHFVSLNINKIIEKNIQQIHSKYTKKKKNQIKDVYKYKFN